MAKFLLGPGGRLLLVSAKPLSFEQARPADTQSVALTPFYLGSANTVFNVSTNAASDDTAGDVPFVFTYTGAAPQGAHVQGRVVDATGAAVPGADWTTLQNVVANDTDKTALGYLPNVRAGIGYKREIRIEALGGTRTHADAAGFNVGPGFLPWGQSNKVGTLDGNIDSGALVAGSSISEYNRYLADKRATFFGMNGAYFGNGSTIGSYNVVLGGGLSMLRLLGDRLKAKFGRDVGLMMNPWARNSTAITQFVPAAMLTQSGTAGGTIGFSSPAHAASGDYRVVAWHQGESDLNPTRAGRFANLKAFCEMHLAHVAKFGRPPSKLTFLFAMMGCANPSHMEVLRGAVLDIVAYGKTQGWDVRIGWSCIDLDPRANAGDSLHFNGTDKTRSNRRLTQALQNVLDPVNNPRGARGPALTGAYSRSGDNVTLTVEHEGGAALAAKNSGAAITGWYANTAADFAGTDLAVTGVTILSATQVRVTVASAPATLYLKHCGGRAGTTQSNLPNVDNLIFDDFVYPTGAHASEQFTGLPLLPTPDPITVT